MMMFIGADRRDRAHEGRDAAADVVATPRKQVNNIADFP